MDKKKQEIKDELESISPFLANLERKAPFQVPTDYFKSMEEEVWEQVRPQTAPEKQAAPKQSWLEQIEMALLSLWQPRLALGLASFLLVLTVGWYVQSETASSASDGPVLAAAPLLEEASDYLADHLDDFDTELLVQGLELDEQDLGLLSSDEVLSDEATLDQFFDELLDELDTDDLEQLL
ncbi:MAG: hypothetical protein AAGD05_06435 [Bacteroidota bacterium]